MLLKNMILVLLVLFSVDAALADPPGGPRSFPPPNKELKVNEYVTILKQEFEATEFIYTNNLSKASPEVIGKAWTGMKDDSKLIVNVSDLWCPGITKKWWRKNEKMYLVVRLIGYLGTENPFTYTKVMNSVLYDGKEKDPLDMTKTNNREIVIDGTKINKVVAQLLDDAKKSKMAAGELQLQLDLMTVEKDERKTWQKFYLPTTHAWGGFANNPSDTLDCDYKLKAKVSAPTGPVEQDVRSLRAR